MKIRIVVYSLLLVFALQVGCCVMPTHTWYDLPSPNQIDTKEIATWCGNVDLLSFVNEWVRETARRYDNFILITVHGEMLHGQFYTFADRGRPELIQTVVERIRRRYGDDRRIVLVVCNEAGLVIDFPKVTYARDIVWAQPDSFVSIFLNRRRDKDDDNIGDIFEFVENP